MLKVICSSPGELSHVFQAMLENATRICEAKFGILYLARGRRASARSPAQRAPAYANGANPMQGADRPEPNASGASASDQQVVQIADITTTGLHRADPRCRSPSSFGGYRTVLIVPMLKENES